MSDRSNTILQNNINNNRLSQQSQAGVAFLDPSFDFQGYGPSTNAYGLTDSSSSGNSAGDSQFSFPVRHPSQSEAVGSPNSSYAPSVSEGRNSISYGQTPFKMPTAINQDRRTSSPAVIARAQQMSQNNPAFTSPLSGQAEMHTAHWTPNFSFGNPTNATNVAPTQPRYPDHYNPSHASRNSDMNHQRRGSQGIGMVPDLPPQYNYDRRMSHPILPSHSYDPSALQRQRQQSAVDWRSFAATNNAIRGTNPDSQQQLTGSDGLWNTLDSARGMVAMSHQDGKHVLRVLEFQIDELANGATAADLFRQNMARRSSIPYMPDTGIISEDHNGNGDGSSIFSRYSSIGSNEDPIAMQPAAAGDTPDQASMMNTFSARDNNPGHKKHVCPVCRKRFTRPSSLTTHIYSHTGEKPFTCEVENCGRQFSVISNLRRHKKTHGSDLKEDDSTDDMPDSTTAMQPAT